MTITMIDESKYSKLTPSANEELERLTNEFRESLFDKAYSIANERDTATKEIALRDILDAQQPIDQIIYKNKTSEYKKNQLLMLVSFSATIYAIGGILIYLIKNETFSFKNDLGLIIAIIGVLLALFSVLVSQLISKRNLFTFAGLSQKYDDNVDSLEIVRRWQIIENLAKKVMTESDKKELTSSSVSFIIRFLSHKIAKDKTEFLKIRELLRLRSKILHENYKLNSKEKKEYINFADDLIERLELINAQKDETTGSLKIINAIYGTSKKSLDATKELNQLVNKNRLELIANNEIIGDPDIGTVKDLKITYELNGMTYTKSFKEGDKVIIES